MKHYIMCKIAFLSDDCQWFTVISDSSIAYNEGHRVQRIR